MKKIFQHTERKYRPDIDGLRAIAIVSVIAYHAGIPGFPGGFVVVEVSAGIFRVFFRCKHITKANGITAGPKSNFVI